MLHLLLVQMSINVHHDCETKEIVGDGRAREVDLGPGVRAQDRPGLGLR